MHRVLLLGAGKIGSAIAKFLSSTDDYDVLVGDVDECALARLSSLNNVKTTRTDSSDADQLKTSIHGQQSVVVAMESRLNAAVARAAMDAGASYFDLTEDVETASVTQQLAASARARQIFMPQCGLAPGFISIAAAALAKRFEKLESVELRVGALPVYPTNALKYNLTWSTDGLINEYSNRCEAIENGEMTRVPPLEGVEHFSLDGVEYEAFNTSGGLGTLAMTFSGNVRTLNYKTVRYRGHRDLIFFMLHGLRLKKRPAMLKEILEAALPTTTQDVVLIFVTVTGMKDGRLTQISDARKIYHAQVLGEPWTAIQITTAAGVCAALDLHAIQRRFKHGFVRQEDVPLEEFLANRFGRYYASEERQMPIKNLVSSPGIPGEGEMR